jgi:hypothetical protein
MTTATAPRHGEHGHTYDSACAGCRLLTGIRVLARYERRLSAAWRDDVMPRIADVAEDVTAMACMLQTPDPAPVPRGGPASTGHGPDGGDV